MPQPDPPGAAAPAEPRPWLPPKVEASIAAFCMAAMTAIVFANVLVRYFTNASLAFSEEFAVFLMVAMTFFGAAAAAAGNHHIRITILVDRLGPRRRAMVDLLVELLSAGTFVWLAWLCAVQTHDAWRFEDVSPGMAIPMWLYWMWLPLLSLAIALRMAGRWLRSRRAGEGGGDVA